VTFEHARISGTVPSIDRGTVAAYPSVAYGEGPPLLVLPGVNDPLLRAGERRWFDLVLASYCRRQARVCAAAGAPRTVYYCSRPPNVPDSVREMALGYRRVLDRLGPCDVLGISMGGFLALELARADNRVRSVTLGLAAARLSRHGRQSIRTWQAWAEQGEWLRIYWAGVRSVVTGIRRAVGGLAARAFDATRSPDTRDVARTLAATLAFDARSWLDEVEPPALVVGGTADPFFTDAAFEAAAAELGGRHVRLDGWGHDAVIEGGRLVDESVARFLSDA
jgi:pimeloyl-ACP methyl ester carboxylesterase